MKLRIVYDKRFKLYYIQRRSWFFMWEYVDNWGDVAAGSSHEFYTASLKCAENKLEDIKASIQANRRAIEVIKVVDV